MACRIGITTDPDRRKTEWQREYPNLRNWQILETHNTKPAAQAAEDRLAKAYGCVAHPGGDGDYYDTWSVYYFQY